MRAFGLVVITVLLAAAAAQPAAAQDAGQDGGGISSTSISRCAGKVGIETRRDDPAFGLLVLDGMPWVTIERTEEKVGSQTIATTVTGIGAERRRDGTMAPFRFTCLLDDRGNAVMFHDTEVQLDIGDTLPPALVVGGTAGLAEHTAVLPRGAELRLQLLDPASTGNPIVTEQVVRSAWEEQIPFALRVPRGLALGGHKLELTARLVADGKLLFQLAKPVALTSDDFGKPVAFTMTRP
jgi:hypothetical protein